MIDDGDIFTSEIEIEQKQKSEYPIWRLDDGNPNNEIFVLDQTCVYIYICVCVEFEIIKKWSKLYKFITIWLPGLSNQC